MLRTFRIKDWHGRVYEMSDRKIWNRVNEDSSKLYNWLFPAEELLRVCNSIGFNREYALDIKKAILDCYAETILRGGDIDYSVNYEDAIDIRRNFLESFIRRVIFRTFLCYTGEEYKRAKQEWIKSKIEELLALEEFDFMGQEESIRSEYQTYIREKISRGEINPEVIEHRFSANIDEPVPEIKEAMAKGCELEARTKAQSERAERLEESFGEEQERINDDGEEQGDE